VIDAALDNLRYPNLVCFFYCNQLSTMIVDMDDCELAEQILSCIFERLLIEKPHPWGVIYLFLKALKHSNFCQKKVFLDNEKFINEVVQKIVQKINLKVNHN